MHEEELMNIYGGQDIINTTVVNALVRLINTALELGRTLGTIIKRATSKNACQSVD